MKKKKFTEVLRLIISKRSSCQLLKPICILKLSCQLLVLLTFSLGEVCAKGCLPTLHHEFTNSSEQESNLNGH